MTLFTDYCQRHGLTPSSKEVRELYRDYRRQLGMFHSTAGQGTEDELRSHSFPFAMGEGTVSRISDSRFMVRDQRQGLFAMCEREHITVERWPAVPELGEPAGARLVLSAFGDWRVALCEHEFGRCAPVGVLCGRRTDGGWRVSRPTPVTSQRQILKRDTLSRH